MTTTNDPKELSVEAILKIAAEVAGDPTRFAVYENKPVEFVEEILGVTLWSKQKEAIRLLVKNPAVAVRSGHSVGKTVVAACAVLWWLYARQGLIITTAPTKEQMEDVLWREIGMRWRQAKVPLPGECYKTYLKVTNDWYAVGITTDQPEAFRGRHHPRLFVVVDEANGVSETIHEEISSLATGGENCRFMISNPTTMDGTFYDAFNKQGVWKKLHISCLDHPNVTTGVEMIKGAVTRAWVEEARQKYGENHPYWYSRVLGDFPKVSSRGVIPLLWVEKCINDTKRFEALKQAEEEKIPRVGGLDVARYGDNRCVLMIRRGDAIEHMEAWNHTNLMETTGRGLKAIKDWGLELLVVDASGIGAGVVDRMLEQGAPVMAYNGGHRAFTPSSFSNRRSELWWSARQRFEQGRLWLPEKHELTKLLIADLIRPEYAINSSGRIQVESKEKMLERNVKSPDFADALVQCFAIDQDPTAPEPIKAGPRQDPVAIEIPTDDSHFSDLGWGY